MGAHSCGDRPGSPLPLPPGDEKPTLGGDFRALTADEAAVLSLLLSQPFPGREALAAQFRSLRGRPVDVDGSLQLESVTGPPAEVVRRIPVEADGVDEAGAPTHILLHVVNGRMVELEVFREDGKVPVGRIGQLQLLIL